MGRGVFPEDVFLVSSAITPLCSSCRRRQYRVSVAIILQPLVPFLPRDHHRGPRGRRHFRYPRLGMNPKLRPVDAQWIEHEGHPALLLQDRSAIGSRVVLVPQALAPLLALCDDTRDVAALGADLEQMAAIRLSASAIEQAISQLDRALLLDNERFSLSLIHISEPTRRTPISYAVFCL